MKRECERLWEVDAIRDGRLSDAEVDAHARHRRACAACSDRFAHDEELAQLGRQLHADAPDPLRARRWRTAILRSAAGPIRSRRPRLAWVAIAAAMLFVGAVVWARGGLFRPKTVTPAPSTEVAELAARVTPAPGARFVQRREGDVERVTLEAGVVQLDVRHQTARERFLVTLPDGEIEVRGTHFEVEVADAVTVHVAVTDGLVALRLQGRDEVLLAAGTEWRPAIETHGSMVAPPPVASTGTAVAVASVPTASAPIPPAVASSVAVQDPVGESDAAYAAAAGLVRSGKNVEAARALAAFRAAYPASPWCEDATYLEALALQRSGDVAGAGNVADEFLRRYPTGFRARDAAMLSAGAARARGDCARVKSVLAPFRGSDVDALVEKCATP